MVIDSLYFEIVIDIIALFTFLLSLWQEKRLRNKVNVSEVLTQTDVDVLNSLLKKFEGDIAQLRAETSGTKVSIFDYVDQVLRPLKQRLATRETRDSQKLPENSEKKGGIIPNPYGTYK